MKKLLLVSLCFLMLGITQVYAQNRTITGTVTSKDDGLPLPGVSVTVTGQSIGTQTGVSGKFTLSVPASASSLSFSFIGYATQQVAIGAGDVVNVTLSPAATQLGEVVVTGALGITRTRNQQAYSAQQVGGEETTKTRNSNFISGLSGKVAGLEVRQNNGLGGSTNVVLRGNKSIFGDNQAMFVVDGVPYANSSVSTAGQASGTGGYDYGNPATDINPDDIESITVLKGPNGSALYGSRGANGVVLITTKKAKKGLGITVNTSVSKGSIDKSTFAKYQQEYGAGYGPGNTNAGIDAFNHFDIDGDGNDDLVVQLDADGSLGPRFDPSLLVYQSDAFDQFSPNFGKKTPWIAAVNGPETFFISPISNQQSVFITNGGDNSSFKLGYTRNDDNGYMPNSNVLKNALDLAASYNISSKLTAAASINYTRTDGRGRYGSGYQAENILNSFRQWYQVNVDIQQQKSRYFGSDERNATWNYYSPTNTKAIYWDNPYFVRYQNYETDSRNRYFGNTNLTYKVTSWLNLLGRVTIDNYNQLQEERRQVGTTGISGYTRRNLDYNETNFDFLANLDKNLTDDLNLKFVLGSNIRKRNNGSISAATNGGLVVPSVFALSNSVSAVLTPTEVRSIRQTTGVFAGATFTYKNMLVLDGTIRRDVASTLPEAYNTYWYPSVNVGFTFSELLKEYDWLSYGKIRGGYANVGNDTDPYRIFDSYSFGTPFGTATQASVSTQKNNQLLKPEQNESYEGGLELEFFNSRFGISGSYYDSRLVDQIIPVTVSTATGYTSFILNSGTVQNKGIELTAFVVPFKTNDFSWRMTVNYTRNRNKVLELFKDAQGNQSQNLQISSFQGGISLNATIGQPLGTIRGSDFIYTNGQRTVGTDGFYLQTPNSNAIIGNVNPDWIGGINNSFTYKNFNLSFLIDVRKGGSLFSLDNYYGFDTGLYPETAGLNDLGNPSRDPVTNDASSGGVIMPGVKEDGSPNDVHADNTGNTFSSAFGYGYNPNAAFIYDASYVKLREAALTYSFPQSLVSKIGNGAVKGIDLGVSGRNLWIIHKNSPYSDPEEGLAYGNLQGYQSGAFPTQRTFILNLKLRF